MHQSTHLKQREGNVSVLEEGASQFVAVGGASITLQDDLPERTSGLVKEGHVRARHLLHA